MSITRIIGRWRLLAGVVVLVVGAGSVVSGQSFPGGLPALVEEVLAALTALEGQAGNVQAGIAGLQSDVDALQESVDALGTVVESPVRTTPAVFYRKGVGDCIATNVASAARKIRIEMVNGTTGAVIFSDPGTIATDPGLSRSVGIVGGTGRTFCRFTVLDGTRADIRGTMTLGASITDDTSILAVPAE